MKSASFVSSMSSAISAQGLAALFIGRQAVRKNVLRTACFIYIIIIIIITIITTIVTITITITVTITITIIPSFVVLLNCFYLNP